MTSEALDLGQTRGDSLHSPEPIGLPIAALLRHMMALGSSGSGKTVLCKVVVEEFVRHGVPALVLDPQGDLCSLALASEDPDALVERGLDPALVRAFGEQADVVVFTPASDKGVALGADPLAALAAGEVDDETWSRAAGMIAALLGDSADDDDGAGLIAVLDMILRTLAGQDRSPRSLIELTATLAELDDAALKPYAKFWDVKKIRGAIQKLARLEVGPRRRLFTGGVPLDIDVLLGRKGDAATPAGKTRVAVVYLNGLHGQEDKEFLVAAIAERLYAWMLANPSAEPQALFYLDEIAPYMPPVRKPQCKDSLQLVFKQARKYGVCCLMATQNPGDVDYRAMAQFGTWALGRLTTRQDLKKVEPTIKSLAPSDCESVIAELPRLEPGQFVLLSPDHLDQPAALQCRWLYSVHETLDESRIAALADERWRERFASSIVEAKREPVATKKATAKVEVDEADEPEVEPAEPSAKKPTAKKSTTKKPTAKKPTAKKPTAKKPTAKKPTAKPEPEPSEPESSEPEASEPTPSAPASPPNHAELAVLRAHGPIDAKRFAELLACSETRARRVLDALLATHQVGSFKQGRSQQFWALDTGTRPDLGLPELVSVATPLFDQLRAGALAQTHVQSTLFGLGGPAETLINLALVHRLLWRVDFEERIESGLLARLVGPGYEDRIASVYLHPRTLSTLTWDRERGLRFVDRPHEHASEIHDLDGVVRFARLAPAGLRFDEADWAERQSEAAVVAAVKTRWPIRVTSVQPVFVPVWKAMIRRHQPEGMRVVVLDAIAGHLVDWP
ncbi:helicase HerA-like domain-containing protein [Nannocystaceae bacterium ST9]